jgi:hypothetical protein
MGGIIVDWEGRVAKNMEHETWDIDGNSEGGKLVEAWDVNSGKQNE